MGTPAYPSPALPCSPASPGGPSLFPALPRPSPHIPGQPLVLGLEQSLREACCCHCCFWIACTAPFWASALHLYPREGLYFVEKSLLSHPSIAARASLWSCSVVATCNARLAAGRAGPSQLASFPSRAFPPPSHCSRSCGSGELGELSAYPCLGPLQPRLCSFALEDRQRGRCRRLESSDPPPHTHTPPVLRAAISASVRGVHLSQFGAVVAATSPGGAVLLRAPWRRPRAPQPPAWNRVGAAGMWK